LDCEKATEAPGVAMKINELRQQLSEARSPVILQAAGREVAVNSREELMIPSSGNQFCAFVSGAFEVFDCNRVSIVRRVE